MVEIKTEQKEDVHFIYVHGDIDASSSIHLDNAFKEAQESDFSKVAVDLSNLEYISSAGLGVFVSNLDEFNVQEMKLVLFGIRETVMQVFDILGLEKIMTIVANEAEAIATLNE